jgi:hypothetical protein
MEYFPFSIGPVWCTTGPTGDVSLPLVDHAPLERVVGGGMVAHRTEYYLGSGVFKEKLETEQND